MLLKHISVATLLGSLVASPAQADIQFNYANASQVATSIKIANEKVHIEFVDNGKEIALLFDAQQNKIFMLNHEVQEYADVGQMARLMKMMVAQLGGAFAEALVESASKQQTEAEAAKTKANFEQAIEEGSKKFLDENIEIKADAIFTGEQVSVGGYTCEKVSVLIAKDNKEGCFINADQLNMSAEDAAAWQAFTIEMAKIDEILEVTAKSNLGFIAGYKGVLAKAYSADEMVLQSVELADIDRSAWRFLAITVFKIWTCLKTCSSNS